jgi:NADH:flavin oxidoreductase / NADH oxidase family
MKPSPAGRRACPVRFIVTELNTDAEADLTQTLLDGADVGTLFSTVMIAGLKLKNRWVMAPMTRQFSPGGVPGADVAAYYGRRAASLGLLITEGTYVDESSGLSGAGASVLRCGAARGLAGRRGSRARRGRRDLPAVVAPRRRAQACCASLKMPMKPGWPGSHRFAA